MKRLFLIPSAWLRPKIAWCLVAGALLCGCSLLFRESRTWLKPLPAQSGSSVTFRGTVDGRTKSVGFVCGEHPTMGQRLRITVVQHGTYELSLRPGDHGIIHVSPGILTELYRGEAGPLGDEIVFWFNFNNSPGRIPCEFQVDVSEPAELPKAVRAYIFKSSPPM